MMIKFDKEFQNQNNILIAGMDEAGRGPLAGPVVCACVVMPLDEQNIIAGVNDSKKLSAKKREALYQQIIDKALCYQIEFVSEKTIDQINILNATKMAMTNCVANLSAVPQVVLIDAVKLDLPIKSFAIIKGDAKSYSIACASILAKVARDKYMLEMHKAHPKYLFNQHKGYGTQKHIQLLKQFGPCEVHRKSFIKNFVEVS
jgi:ribonuclease HII